MSVLLFAWLIPSPYTALFSLKDGAISCFILEARKIVGEQPLPVGKIF